jgi:hypothetical protein
VKPDPQLLGSVRGAVRATPRSVVRGFSHFEYESAGPSEQQRQRSPRLQPIFKHAGVATAPKQAGTFNRFTYKSDPHDAKHKRERVEQIGERHKIRSGAFIAGGNALGVANPSARRSAELRAQLVWALREGVPAFLRVTEDARGYLLAVFSAVTAADHAARACIKTYMDHFVSYRATAVDFCLTRDLSRWGALAGSGAEEVLVFALRPPWANRRAPRAKEERPTAARACPLRRPDLDIRAFADDGPTACAASYRGSRR